MAKVNTGYTLTPETIAALKAFCKAGDRVISATVERAIVEYLTNQGHPPTAAK